ncbi:MAG: hypothetical protein AAGG01_18755 [Planctomycetota bacterium]
MTDRYLGRNLRPGRKPLSSAVPGSVLAVSLLGASLLGAGCASGPSSIDKRLESIETLVRSRAYVEAAEASVELAREVSEDSPRWPEVREAQRTISLASQLDQARGLTLNGDDEEALEILDRLNEEYPGTPQVEAWRDRTRRKLASKWFSVAREALANETFDAAREAYKYVLEYDPNHPVAGLSLDDLTRLEEYRAELAGDYYSSGVRGVVARELSEARTNFQKSLKYNETNEKAKRRIDEVDRARAKDRVASAEKLIKDGLFGAAALEYAVAADLDPESKAIQEGLEAARREAKAKALMSEAEFLILRGEIERAEALLEEGAKLSSLQSESFTEADGAVQDARTDVLYQAALDLEHDFLFPDAIVAYGEVLKTRDFYKDTRARIDALEGYVASAERIYAEAQAATSSDEKLKLLQEIDVFWPEYLDVAEQIRTLKAASGSANR